MSNIATAPAAPSAEIIRAEFDRIHQALSNRTTPDDQYARLYAARAAMDWMLGSMISSPYDEIMRAGSDPAAQRRAWLLALDLKRK